MTLVWAPGFNGVTDPDAQTYLAAVEAADGQALEGDVALAINDFVVGCKLDGIWDAIKASCILAGARTLSGALVPLKGTAPTNNNFVSGDYNRETGLVGDGSTKYLNSNRNNNADPQNSKHIAIYVAAAPTNTCALMGARETIEAETGSSQIIHLITPSSSFRIHSAALANSANGIGIGLAGASRTASNAINWRHSSSFTGADTTASQTPFSINIHVFQRSGTAGNVPTDARLSFYSIGESIDLEKLDNRTTRLMNLITYSFTAGLPELATMDLDAASYIGGAYRAGATLS
jgi:hypothetical protein